METVTAMPACSHGDDLLALVVALVGDGLDRHRWPSPPAPRAPSSTRHRGRSRGSSPRARRSDDAWFRRHSARCSRRRGAACSSSPWRGQSGSVSETCVSPVLSMRCSMARRASRLLPVVRELLDRRATARASGGCMPVLVRTSSARSSSAMYRSIAASISPRRRLQLLAREALGLGVDGFELAAVDRDDAGVQQIDVAAEARRTARQTLRIAGPLSRAEIGDRLEVGLQAAGEPDQLQIALRTRAPGRAMTAPG